MLNRAAMALSGESNILVLEALTLATCPAQFETRIGNWVLRCSQSKVMRANTITVFADDNLSAEALHVRLQICADFYAQWQKKIHFRISEHTATMAVNRALAQHGYVQYDHTVVMQKTDLAAADLSHFPNHWRPTPIDVGDATQWRMITRGEAAEAAAIEAAAARDYGKSMQQNAIETWLDETIKHGAVPKADDAKPLLPSPPTLSTPSTPLPRKTFACALYDGEKNRIASGVARTYGTHVGLFNIYTTPAHRGQGCGHAITQRLLAWAQREGMEAAFLQVEADNQSAISLYARVGFAGVYSYHYCREA